MDNLGATDTFLRGKVIEALCGLRSAGVELGARLCSACPWTASWSYWYRNLPGVTAAQWLMPGGVFLAASVPSSDFLMAVEQRMLHLRIYLIAVTLQLVAGLVVLRTGGDIEEIAATTTASTEESENTRSASCVVSTAGYRVFMRSRRDTSTSQTTTEATSGSSDRQGRRRNAGSNGERGRRRTRGRYRG